MKLSTILVNNYDQLGIVLQNKIYLCSDISKELPHTMKAFLSGGKDTMQAMLDIEESLINNSIDVRALVLNDCLLLPPVPQPTSLRDAYAFRQHVLTSRRNRGLQMIPEFDQFPVFYFSNHRAVFGPGSIYCMPLHLDQLDFELEVAIVINKAGKNIKASDADDYIAGYMIMNDFSARKLQMEEMKLNLGPAKGKDFATSLGPFLVTKDELEPYKTKTKEGHIGDSFNLQMTCTVNGIQVSNGNLQDMDWTFAEIIERASYGVDLMPGDIIGSGTVGTGCFLELNGTSRLENPNHVDQWLKVGDKISLEVTKLGVLTNTICSFNE